MKSIATVNVIERTEVSLFSVRSFPDTEEGNKSAEKLFVEIIKEQDESRAGFASNEEEIEEYIEEGFYCSGNYELALAHSGGR